MRVAGGGRAPALPPPASRLPARARVALARRPPHRRRAPLPRPRRLVGGRWGGGAGAGRVASGRPRPVRPSTEVGPKRASDRSPAHRKVGVHRQPPHGPGCTDGLFLTFLGGALSKRRGPSVRTRAHWGHLRRSIGSAPHAGRDVVHGHPRASASAADPSSAGFESPLLSVHVLVQATGHVSVRCHATTVSSISAEDEPAASPDLRRKYQLELPSFSSGSSFFPPVIPTLLSNPFPRPRRSKW